MSKALGTAADSGASHWSRREREVMDIIHRLRRASAAEVRQAMAEPPTDAAVRAVLRGLVEKGDLRRSYDGPRYVYTSVVPVEEVRRSAVRHLLDTFFDGSAPSAMAALLESEAGQLDDAERSRLKVMIDRAAEAGR